MPVLITSPTEIQAAGKIPKRIREYVGNVNSKTRDLSIAMMDSPVGWAEPGQRPEFDEYTLVLQGALNVEVEDGPPILVEAGQALMTRAGEWVRYSTPGGAQYLAVCRPAFSPQTVHRDDEHA